MLRTKILGQEHFNQAVIAYPANTNIDMGHFIIGSGELTATAFEDVPVPPKYLWIRARMIFELCSDTPILRKTSSFVWPGAGRCKSVKLTGYQILHAQKDYEIDTCWMLSKEQPIFEYKFAVAPTMYGDTEDIHLWPCGGNIGDAPKIEQLFAQVASEGCEVLINSLSTWEKHKDDDIHIVFEPPPVNKISLSSTLSQGGFSILIEQSGLEYVFSSCRVESTEPQGFIDILCERKD